MATIFGFDAGTVETFDRAYVASKPTPVQALFAGDLGQQNSAGQAIQPLDAYARYELAVQLAQRGFIIDEDIDAHGADPYLTMLVREQYGNTWEPSAMQPAAEGPCTGPVPAGAIKVSTNLADYPPFTPPAAPETPTAGPLVGNLLFGSMYALSKLASDLYASGKLPPTTSQDGQNFRLVVNQFVIGTQIYWEVA